MKNVTKLVVHGASLSPRVLFGAAAVSMLALVPGACSNDAEDCQKLKTCGGASGTSGSSSGGASGSSGTSGTSGAAGMGGGDGGDGGTAGAGIGGTSGTSGGDGGSAGDGGAGGGEPPCDATKSPNEDVCVIDEEYGVFVSPDGDDDAGDGSRANPYSTLGKAVEEAATSDKRVYACADSGTYDESVNLDDSANGLEMFGGFSCDEWRYSDTEKSSVASSTTLALRIEGVTGVRIEDFAFEAADATLPGESSIGAFVASSSDIVFRRVRIEAGLGADGENGVVVPFTFPEQASLNGNNASGTLGVAGGAEKICMCEGGAATSGGPGGNGSLGGQDGGNGTPDYSGPGGDGGDAAMACNMGGGGSNGANPPPAVPATGAATPGTLNASGWTPAVGANGVSGSPGQGGGGGASSTVGGGGGGCGGCGGAGGPGGKGGGASIALIVFQSTVSVSSSVLVSVDAGAGGDGTPGQDGQMEAGFGGNGGGGGACQGGNGGLGGKGGAGGGGAGGISVGILWSGEAEPVRTGGTITVGAAGEAGTGGDPGVNDGIAGLSLQVLQAP